MADQLLLVADPPETILVIADDATDVLAFLPHESMVLVIPDQPEVVLVVAREAPDQVVFTPAAEPGLVFVTPPRGPQGLRGPAGQSGYRHVQAAPAATWIIEHGLGRYPAVVILLTGESTPVYADLSYPDLNTLSIEFPEPLSGIAEM